MATEQSRKLRKWASVALELKVASPEKVMKAVQACEEGRAQDPGEWLERERIINRAQREMVAAKVDPKSQATADTQVESARRALAAAEPTAAGPAPVPPPLAATAPAPRRPATPPPAPPPLPVPVQPTLPRNDPHNTVSMRHRPGGEDATIQPGPTPPRRPTPPVGAPRIMESGGDRLSPEHEGRYSPLRVHATGGQARILVVHDEHIDRDVALKELHFDGAHDLRQESLSSAETQRLLREARVTGQLEHPNIVPVYDLGRRREGGALYYTMRYVRGVTLAQRLKDCRSLPERLRLLKPFLDMCSAIAYAHSKGIIHRDIKPANSMVGEFGETVIIDWGIAKVAGREDIRARVIEKELELLRENATTETVTGEAIGTPSYMSPEQARGDIPGIDERSDVWGLGAVLYQILTGLPPINAPGRAETMRLAVEGNVPPVRQICPEAPPELAAVAEKALRKEKDDRYQSAKELADEVEAYMTGGRVRAYHYSSWDVVRRFAAQNKAAVSAAGLVLLVIVGALIAVTVALGRETEARLDMTAAREREHRERLVAHFHLARAYAERADRFMADYRFSSAAGFAALSLEHNPAHPRSPFYDAAVAATLADGQPLRVKAASTVYQAGFHSAVELMESVSSREALTSAAFSPDGVRVAAGSDDGSVLLWDAERRKQLNVLEGHSDRVHAVAFSADGSLLASGGRDRKVVVWNPRSGERLWQEECGELVRAVAFSPAGLLASAGGEKVVRLWNPRTGAPAGTLSGHSGQVNALAFSPDGSLLASAGSDRVLRLWRMPGGEPVATLGCQSSDIFSVAFSPDGRSLAVGANEALVRVYDVASGRLTVSAEGNGSGVQWVAYSPDGRILASGGLDKTLRLWNADTGRALVTLEGHQGFVTGVAFSPNSDRLVSASFDHTLKLWRVGNRGSLGALAGHQESVHGVVYSPDGSRLASASRDRTVRIWDPLRRKLLFTLPGHQAMVDRLAFSPDGAFVASASRDRTVRVWNVRAGELAYKLDLPEVTHGVSFSPDGGVLATSGADRAVRLWETKSGRQLRAFHGHESVVTDVAFSPDGEALVTASQDKTIIVWNMAAAKAMRVLSGHQDWVWDTDFSPDGKLLASGGKDGAVIVWDVASGKELRRLAGHTQWVNSVRFSRDGKLVAAGGDDKTARVWRVEDGLPLLSLNAAKEVVGVAFSPDGSTLAVGDGNVVTLFPLDFSALEADPKKLLEEAKADGFDPGEAGEAR